MAAITDTAMSFFEACDTGKGWQACKDYCTPDATFSSQAEPLLEINTLQDYCDWMTGLMQITPDARYELKSFAVDPKRTLYTRG